MHWNKAIIAVILWAFFITGCKHPVQTREDNIYSRHLQEHIPLTIIATPLPDDRKMVNLLLLNDGQDMAVLRVKEIVDSLYKKKQIPSMMVVGIHAVNRMDDYGVGGFPDYQQHGSKADKYDAFIDDELLDFIKKKAGIRKFNSIVLAGASLGGLSAMDIAWNHADKINKVGVFSGSFWWRDKDASAADYSDENNRILLNKIRSSRKRPHLKYWFYAGEKEEAGDRNMNGVIDVVDDTQDLVNIIKAKNVCAPEDIQFTISPTGTHDNQSWSKVFPDFLLWAFK